MTCADAWRKIYSNRANLIVKRVSDEPISVIAESIGAAIVLGGTQIGRDAQDAATAG